MVMTKTPFRISFFGGGTDYPTWYHKHGGAVLSTTIDKYCYISVRNLPPFYEDKYRIVWSHIENVPSVSQILHPAVREILKMYGYNGHGGLEIHHQGDLPARAGMGSSSSFAAGMIRALEALHGRMIGKHELALKAIHVEQDLLKDNVGSQDQVAAAYGGFNVIRFVSNGGIQIEPVTVDPLRVKQLDKHLMLFYVGTSRLASEIAKDVIENMDSKQNALFKMRDMVDQAIGILNSTQSLDSFGELMHEAWTLKQSLSTQISNPQVEKLYTLAREHGALGGKLLGAGGSGFMCLYVPLERQQHMLEALDSYLHVPFSFESEGCTTIHYKPE